MSDANTLFPPANYHNVSWWKRNASFPDVQCENGVQEYQLNIFLTEYLEINKWTLESVLISGHSDLRKSFITILATGLVVGIIVLLKLREEAKKSSWFIDLLFWLAWNKWTGINSLCVYWLLYKRTCKRVSWILLKVAQNVSW